MSIAWVRKLFAQPARPRPARRAARFEVSNLEDRTVPANFYVDNAVDFVIDTDTGLVGLSPGDTVTWNPGGVAGVSGQHGTKGQVTGLTFGANAFTSIQSAVDTALANDVVFVAAGTYSENIISVNKAALQLLGAQDGVPASSAAARPTFGESVVRPAFLNVNQGNQFSITANGVLLSGFTLNGDAGAGIAAARGIANGNDGGGFTNISGLVASNNIILNYDRMGFGLVGPVGVNTFASNFVSAPAGNASGAVPDSPSSGLARYGVFVGGGPGQTISNNTIGVNGADAGPTVGIGIFNPTSAQTLTNNTLTGGQFGIVAVGGTTTVSNTFGGVSGAAQVGVLATNKFVSGSLPGTASGASEVVLSGTPVTATGGGTAVRVLDDSATLTDTVTLNLTAAGTISTGTGGTGLRLSGDKALLTGNSLQTTAFTGGSGQFVRLESAAYDTAVVDGTGASYGGVVGSAATDSQGLVIEDRLTHYADATGIGFIEIKSGHGYATPASGSIARLLTAPAFTAGDRVVIGTGSYSESVNTAALNVTLAPASTATKYGQVTLTGDLDLGASTTVEMQVGDPASGTTLDRFTFSGAGNGLTVNPATALTVDFAGYTPVFADEITLFDGTVGTPAIGGTFAGFNTASPNNFITDSSNKYYYLYDYAGNNGDFVLVAIPAVSNGTVNTTYVDDDWAGSSVGQVVLDGADKRVFGYNAFDTIQAGVTNADPASKINPTVTPPLPPAPPGFGTINVRAGNYPLATAVTIPNAAKLFGPNFDKAGDSLSRVAPAVVQSAAATDLFSVTASQVEVYGFDFDDNGTASVYGVTDFNGAGGLDDLIVQNNLFTFTSATPGAALDLYGANGGANESTGLLVDSNRIVGATTGVQAVFGDVYGTISNNVLEAIEADGIFLANYSVAVTKAVTVSGNTIGLAAGASAGIRVDNVAATADGVFTISGNTVTVGDQLGDGIYVSKVASPTTVALTNNTVNNGLYGIAVEGVLSATIMGGTVAGAVNGISVDEESSGLATTVTITGVTVTGFDTGIVVQDDDDTAGTDVTVTIGDGVVIDGTGNPSAFGVDVVDLVTATDGQATVNFVRTATGATIYGTAIGIYYGDATAGSVAGVTFTPVSPALANGTDLFLFDTTTTLVTVSNSATAAQRNRFAGDYFVQNLTDTDFDLTQYTAAELAGLSPATKTDNFRIEDRIFHKVDSNTVGLVTWVANKVYVTDSTVPDVGGGPSTDSSIQAGIDAVPNGSSGWFVIVERGTYAGNLAVDEKVTILGAQSGADPLAPGRTFADPTTESVVVPAAGKAAFNVSMSSVTIQGFSLDGSAAGTLQGVAELTSVVGTKVHRNFIQGFDSLGVAVAAGSTGFEVSNNTVTGNYAGVYLSDLASGGTVTRNVITGHTGSSFTDDGSGIVLEGNNTNVTVSENQSTGNRRGAYLWDLVGTSLAGTVIVGNDLSGNSVAAIENAEAGVIVNAAGNWFGTNTPAGLTAAVVGNVDVSPFLWTGTDTAPGTMGFQGSFTNLGVTLLGADFDGGTDFRITEGIGYKSGVATLVHVLAGDYAEDVDLNRQPLEVRAEGTVDIDSLAGVALSVFNLNGNTVSIDGTLSTTFAGEVQGNASSILQREAGATTTLSGTSDSYAGTVNVVGGTLVVSGSIGDNTATGSASVAGTLTVTGTFKGNVTAGSGGTVNGTGGSITGNANVNAGGLLAGSGSVGGNVDVDGGGEITRTGTVGGTFTLDAGGKFSPAGVGTEGTLTVTGAATLSGDFYFDLGATQATSDQLVANGVTINASATFFANANVTATSAPFAVFKPINNTSASPTGGQFGDFPQAAIKNLPGVGAMADRFYRGFYNFGPNNDFELLRVVSPPAPSFPGKVFVNDEWFPLALGTNVNNPNTGVGIGVIGFDAYGTVSDAVTSVDVNGLITVFAGDYSNGADVGTISFFQPVTIALANDNTEAAGPARTTIDIAGGLSDDNAGVSFGVQVNLNKNTLEAGGAASTTFAGKVSGTGTVRKTGTGTLTLLGANNYNGPTQIQAGAVIVGTNEVLPDTSAVTVSAGATLDLDGFEETIGSLAGAGDVLLGVAVTSGPPSFDVEGLLTTGGNNLSTVFSGVISGGGRVVKAGVGTMTLTGANTYTVGAAGPNAGLAPTVVASGTLQLGNGGTTGSLAGSVELVSGKLAIGRSNAVTQATVLGGGLILDDGDATTTEGGVVYNGPGTLSLTSGNTYAGDTLVTKGTLVVSNDNQLGVGGDVTVTGSAGVSLGAGVSSARTFTLSGGASLTATGAVELSGAVSGGTLRGAGPITAAGSATFTGVTIASGTTVVTTTGSTATMVSITNQGTVDVPTGSLSTENFVNAGGSKFMVSGDGVVTVNGFQSYGYIRLTGGGAMVNGGTTNLLLGSGSLTDIGYNSFNGAATKLTGGLLDLSETDLVILGGTVRNNGEITGIGNPNGGDNAGLNTIYIGPGGRYFDAGVNQTGAVFTQGYDGGLDNTGGL
jgi:autotransporter-associated beta strand protein/parallel beta-helix repeat protein